VASGGSVLRGLMAITALAFIVAGGVTLSVKAVAVAEERHEPHAEAPSMATLLVANLPFAMCFCVLEGVLPALLVTRLHAGAAWPAALFVGNTVLVVLFQIPVIKWLSKWNRKTVFAASGIVLALSYVGFWLGEAAGAMAVAAVGVLYTLGEILYTGSATALVIASTPPTQLGRALVRFQLSTGIGMAFAPAVLMGLLEAGSGVLWPALAVATLLGSLAMAWRRAVQAPPRRAGISATGGS
jgi:hypothetical protein